MKHNTNRSGVTTALLILLGFAAVLGFSFVFSYFMSTSSNLLILMEKFMAFDVVLSEIQWTENTTKFAILFSLIYGLCIAYFFVSKQNKRVGEEYGSAKWGNPKVLNHKYSDKNPAENIILTKNVRIGLDGYKHKRNTNVLVLGGSGSGKTRGYALPNLLQNGSSSFICTDPKGEILRTVGTELTRQGYEIEVLDLINFKGAFNPFMYMRDEKDVILLVSNLLKNTTPKESKSDDPFWEKAETAYLTAIILYLVAEAPPSEQNFSTVMYMIENSAASEEDEDFRSPVDLLFEALEEDDPDNLAVKQYKIFKQAAGKTAKSILISAAVRLGIFNLPSVARITDHDKLDFGSLGERKRAVFLIIPDSNDAFNFLIGMAYTCAFAELYYRADNIYKGRLPVYVHCLMDEWANVALPNSFQTVLSTCRSRSIGISIIVQGVSQIKAKYKDDWENIIGNTDSILFLGGSELTSLEHLNKLLGKSTIQTQTQGLTKGRNGSSSQNFQQTGRELLQPDEVRKLDNDSCILLIRGESPVMDKKYNLSDHPNYRENAPAYVYEDKN